MSDIPTVKLLVVDDNRSFCEAIVETLDEDSAINYLITAVENGEQAYAALKNGQSPYDVFLIDQRLKGDKVDGIELMKTLLEVSPESAAIVLTGYASREDGLRAMRSGALRYIRKTPDWSTLFEELTLIIGSVVESRRTRSEAEWLRVLTEIGQQFQSCLNRDEVAAVLITGARKLGFRQARLWQVFVERGRTWLKGWKQVPANHMSGFEGYLMLRDKSPYAKRTLSGKTPQRFNGRELGASPLDEHYRHTVTVAKEKGWISVPLWVGKRCLGQLTLHHYNGTQPLDRIALSMIQLHADQAAAAFNRVELLEQRTISRQLAAINEQPVPRSDTELDALLQLIWAQVQSVFDEDSFHLCLLDWDARQMDFRLKVERGQKEQRELRPLRPHNGLVAHVAHRNRTVRVSHGVRRYMKRLKLQGFGEEVAQSWLGVPIRHEGAVLGVLAIQDNTQKLAYTKADQQLLEAIANQAAMAIGNAYLSLQAHRSAQQLEVLQYISGEILKLAPLGLDQMLHIVLSAVTAPYGLRLNRAMLFLADGMGQELRGCMGIGQFEKDGKPSDWQQDAPDEITFQGYLSKLQAGHVRPVPLDKIGPALRLSLVDEESIFCDVLRSGEPRRLDVEHDSHRIPQEFHDAVDPYKEMVLIPLKAGGKPIGMLAVDNKFDQRSIDDETFSRLQTFMNQAALAIDTMVQRDMLKRRVRTLEGLSQVQQAIIDIPSDIDLPDVLSSVVQQAARAISGIEAVDAITLYYIDLHSEALHLGALSGVRDEDAVKRGPLGSDSAVGRVLESSQPLFTSDSKNESLLQGRFVEEEDIFATAAIPLMVEEKTVGCVFFNYRRPHEFSEREKHLLRLFAQQAALAIHKAALNDEARRRQRRYETIIRITQIINATLDLDEFIRVVLNEVKREITNARQACIMLLESETGDLVIPPVSFEFYQIDKPNEMERTRIREGEASIAGRVVQMGKKVYVADVRRDPDYLPLVRSTKSEVCVPIRASDELLGVLVLESTRLDAFSPEDQQLLSALADQMAVALKKAQEHAELIKAQNDLAANKAIAWMGLFGSNWSHTVNQRAYQIDGKVYLLRQALSVSDSSRKLVTWLDEIEEATQQIKAMPIAGKFSMVPRAGSHRVRLDEVLEKHIRRWCSRDPHVELHLHLNCEDAQVPIEEGWLEIPLEKLIHNALSAMSGHGKLTVHSARHGSRVEVQVQDTGTGISDEIIKNYLLKKPVPQSTANEGSGLGLLIARKVLEAHGGNLQLLRTEPGKGTVFMFQLPVDDSDDTRRNGD